MHNWIDLNLFSIDECQALLVPLLASNTARLWYAVPLVVVVSLVYGATRHEYLKEILIHSFRSAVWLLSFMAAIFAIIWLMGYGN